MVGRGRRFVFAAAGIAALLISGGGALSSCGPGGGGSGGGTTTTSTSTTTVPLRPDLTVTRTLPTDVYANTPFVEHVVVTNAGAGTAPDFAVVDSNGAVLLAGGAPGATCSQLRTSGRDPRNLGYRCAVAQSLAPGASSAIDVSVKYQNAITTTETFTVSTSATQQNNVSHTFTGTVTVTTPPVPSAPQNVTVTQSNANLVVQWSPPATGAGAVVRSTVTATPDAGAAVVGTLTGNGTSLTVGPVQPSTHYVVTVTSSSTSGTSAASAPVDFTTEDPTIPPGAPSLFHVAWTTNPSTTASALAYWDAPTDPGNSPIDQYEVTATATDTDTPPPPLDVTMAAPSTTGTITGSLSPLDSTYSWNVEVRAHNAAGWGTWSNVLVLPGM